MSAKQRHSRVTTSDGWTTISSSSSSKLSKKKTNGQKKGKNGGYNALLAHKSDLYTNTTDTSTDTPNSNDNKDGLKSTNADEITVKQRINRCYETFLVEEKCCGVLKGIITDYLIGGNVKDGEFGEGGNPGKGRSKKRVKRIIALALGSMSEANTMAPLYQLAALRVIIDAVHLIDGGDIEDEGHMEKKPEERGSGDGKVEILAYDPAFTTLDSTILSTWDIHIVSPTTLGSLSPTEWEESIIYMPHASLWLNHKYLMKKPMVWIGNDFGIYDVAAGEGGEARNVLDEAEGVVESEYGKVGFPMAEEFKGGGVFNNTVIYLRDG